MLLTACSNSSGSYQDGYNYAVSFNTTGGQSLCESGACTFDQASNVCEGFTRFIPPGEDGHAWLLGCEAAAEANAQKPVGG
jgi:hypothetical protein